MNVKLLFQRLLIVTDAFLRGNRKSKLVKNHKVLIVFHMHFGDSILLQHSLCMFPKLFPQDKGYQIKLVARPSVLDFMKSNLKLPQEIQFEPVDFNKFLANYAYYKEIVKRFQGTASTLIVPGTSLSGEIFSASSDAIRKIGVVRSIDVKKPLVMAIFAKLAYTEIVRPSKEDMELQRKRKLLHYLGATNYQAGLPSLLGKPKIVEGRYAVICLGASKIEKCWPTERFAQLANYLIERYHLNIHLCGSSEEIVYEKCFLERVNYPKKVTSHIGNTDFSEWSAIVQHASLVVGNDSATIHLAAAGRVKSVCIAGVYDKYQFFPYKVDKLDQGDRLPVTVLKDMPCAWCRTIGYYAGYGNPECQKRIDSNLCAICIDEISTEEVIVAIDGLMKGNV